MNYRTHYLFNQECSSAYIDANHEREPVKVAQLTINFHYEYRSLYNVQLYITIPTSLFIKYPISLCHSVILALWHKLLLLHSQAQSMTELDVISVTSDDFVDILNAL
jgi:hypothetical protein